MNDDHAGGTEQPITSHVLLARGGRRQPARIHRGAFQGNSPTASCVKAWRERFVGFGSREKLLPPLSVACFLIVLPADERWACGLVEYGQGTLEGRGQGFPKTQVVEVTFLPPRAAPFARDIEFTCRSGRSCVVRVEGEGTVDEVLETAMDRPRAWNSDGVMTRYG